MPKPFVFKATLFAAVALAPLSAALAQGTPMATFLVVHGIPGRDVAPTLDPLLPVDVLIAGKYCLLKGLNFGDIAGPFDVPVGTYAVAVSLANPIAPCSNAAVISANVTLTAGEFGAVVAALSKTGAPTAEVYGIDVSSVPVGEQRFVAAHAAEAPPVRITVKSTAGGTVEVGGFGLVPGAENSATVPERTTFALSARTGSGAIIGPVFVSPGARSVTAAFAVGSAASGSARLLTKVIPAVN